jgi:hypothetical protein
MNLRQFLPLAIFATVVLVAFNGCKNDDDEQPDTKANLEFLFNFTVDGQDFVANDVYTVNGTAVSFEIASFYVSGISLEPQDGSGNIAVDKHLLIAPTAGSQAVTELDAGNYDMLKFDVGVQPESNDQTEEDFTSRSADDPLSIQQPSMHWNWSSGYKFIRLDGLSDVDGDGTPETPIVYHLGSDAFLTNVALQLTDEIKSGDFELEIEVDIAKILTDFDLTVDLDTHTANNIPLAEKMKANLATAFTVK